MSRSREPKHRHYGRTRCGVCSGLRATRRRALADAGPITAAELDEEISSWDHMRIYRRDERTGMWLPCEVEDHDFTSEDVLARDLVSAPDAPTIFAGETHAWSRFATERRLVWSVDVCELPEPALALEVVAGNV